MASKVRVYGKAQNRTALGIMHAYMVMYPHATIEDLNKAFPKALNPDCGVDRIFCLEKDYTGQDWAQWYFTKEDEVLTLGDKQVTAVCTMWTKASFERLVEHAKQYDIEIAKFEAGQRGEKGGFRLEYLNGYVPPVPVVEKKGMNKALLAVIIVLALLLLGALCWMLFGNKKAEPQVVEVEKVVVVHDTLYVQQLEEIEKNFNAAEFAAGKADLNDEVKFVLHDLAKLMQKNPDLRLRLEGHTSAEGDAAFNQKLSEDRAQAAVTFLIEHEGIDANRLEAVGFGSSQLKNEADPKAAENRRTEFIVIE